MPPKRKAAASSGAGTGSSSNNNSSKRQSKLAKEHNISADEEAEIREAFSLFAEPMEGEREGVMPIEDVRRALIALGIPPTDQAELADFVSILDPDDEGFAQYPSFVAICALKLHAAHQGSDAHLREVDDAFSLFTHGGGGSGSSAHRDGSSSSSDQPVITVAHLRRVAAMLQEEDVGDALLRDMILEANGGAGVARGVTRDQFEDVMRRAGVWR
ncbi:hypothetical protein GGTG_00518 [Gaeumannomyces tritici R3-111a-1]|uniref:Calmodulin n=1 Tax=Gaeumannomyces tritici (strain R3-111a-1) TaxID=644352 RepID=J3NGY2_GAET3|nr:hypothetical protein GGTG_00518 [Gaeumannomyces tritici R3-111a-1]EJT80522.1 hypothetical protein GGTG_00518 [Gaeumannomyces tritici R3-111a-1]